MDYFLVNDRYNISNLPLSHFDRIVTPIYAYEELRFNLSFPDDVSEFFSRYQDIEKLVTHEFSGTPIYEIKPEQVLSLVKDGHILKVKPNTSWHVTNAFIVIDGKLKDNTYTFSDFYNKELFHTAFSQKVSRGLKVKDTFVPGYVPEDKEKIIPDWERRLYEGKNTPTKMTNAEKYGKPLDPYSKYSLEELEKNWKKTQDGIKYLSKKLGDGIKNNLGENAANIYGGALSSISSGNIKYGDENSKLFKAADWLTPLPAGKAGKVKKAGNILKKEAEEGIENTAGKVARKETEVTANNTANKTTKKVNENTQIKIDDKIKNQIKDRGWTEKDIKDTIKEDNIIGKSVDKRSANKTIDGLKRDDTATVYGKKDGYVIVNDRTKEVVQIKDKKDPHWKDDSRIKWKDE